MANNREAFGTTVSYRGKVRARKRVVRNNLQPPKPSTFETTLNALQPHLDEAPIASLRISRLTSLAMKAGLRAPDLVVLVSAHKLAAHTELPSDALFALAK